MVTASALPQPLTDEAGEPIPGEPEEVDRDAALNLIVAALKSDPTLRVVIQAELGEGDIQVSERLANPSVESIQSLIRHNRHRKAAIERERSQLAARARSQVFAGASGGQRPTSAAEGASDDLVAQLQALDAERATVERALDELFAYLRPGAERRGDMRTRNAALALANARLDRVRRELLAQVGGAVGQRIDVRRARFRKSTKKKPLQPHGLVTITPK